MGEGDQVKHTGGCHCGAVQFEVDASPNMEITDCNCSICRMSGYWHLIVPVGQFRLLTGDEYLTTYKFGSGIAQHKFCRNCGVKSFYIPRSHPDGVSVNARCLKPETIQSMKFLPFDGLHWEKHIQEINPAHDMLTGE